MSEIGDDGCHKLIVIPQTLLQCIKNECEESENIIRALMAENRQMNQQIIMTAFWEEEWSRSQSTIEKMETNIESISNQFENQRLITNELRKIVQLTLETVAKDQTFMNNEDILAVSQMQNLLQNLCFANKPPSKAEIAM